MRAKITEGCKRATETDKRVGRNLRTLRLQCGLSMAQLARQIDLPYQLIGRFELGRNCISAGHLPTIAAALRVPIDALFEDDDGTRPIAVVGHRLAPFMRDAMAITRSEQLAALNAVARSLAATSPACTASDHGAATEER
ncbi:helix-turn-helix transcriptional regulator [Roseomonas stagni]|uniref:Helix-turn-helix transcriptional regulator n=1 Tax=Falsiroseomonas algicola TaxID=2716930 RepID=A0A6M1LKQ5_9PROT|nr:helix-turn-helix transcriptional regulator [Falsiroseomonas algicola]NGM20712.1 helix-turn-helix transcriptional regulator [Falsiroseomonas algicola]